MKVANKDAIESGEKELLDAIIAELDWGAIEEKLRQKHNIKLQEDVEFRNGDLVVHGNQIAYKVNFDVKITLSVLFDRLGDCLDITASESFGEDPDDDFYDDEADDLAEESEGIETPAVEEPDVDPEPEISAEAVDAVENDTLEPEIESEDIISVEEPIDEAVPEEIETVEPQPETDVKEEVLEEAPEETPEETPKPGNGLASDIAGMIDEINSDE